MPAPARDRSANQHEIDQIDRFLVEAMPLPIASAWHRVLQHDDAPHTASAYAVEALAITLQLLLALLLAEADASSDTSEVRKQLHMLEKPRLGSYGELVLGLARGEGAPGSIRQALHLHFYKRRKQTPPAHALVALGARRNDMIHEGTRVQLDPQVIAGFVADLRLWLFGLRWLAEWRLICVDRTDVRSDGFAGQISPLTGRDREPRPRLARWTAQLPTGEVALVDPTETRVLSLERLVRATKRAGRVDVLLPARYVDGALRLTEGDNTAVFEDQPLDEAEITALLRLGRPALVNVPPPPVADGAGRSRPADTSLRALPQAWVVPDVPAADVAPERSGTAGLLLAGLLAIAALGLLAYWILVPAEGQRPRIAPDLAFGRAPDGDSVGLPLGATPGEVPGDGPGPADDAGAIAATDDADDELAAPSPLVALAASQQAWDAAEHRDCGDLEPLAAELCGDQERVDADAASVDAAIRWDRRCDRAAAVALAAALRGRSGEGVDRLHVLRRAVALERRVLAAARSAATGAPADLDPGAAARERAGAAARALADVAAILVWTDGDPKQRVEAATGEASVQALRGLELSLLCALDEALDLRTPGLGGAAGTSPFELARLDLARLDALRKHVDAFARVAGGLDAGAAPAAASASQLRGCLADAYDGLALHLDAKGRPGRAATPSARRLAMQWQAAELRAADVVCCGAGARDAACGDQVEACAAFDALADAALAVCTEATVAADAGLLACLSAIDATARVVASRAALPAHDPRCLPAIFVPQQAAEVLLALRRDVPAPTAAVATPRLDGASPRDAALGRWLVAIEALGARAARDPDAAREFEPLALAAARVLVVAGHAPPPGGCGYGMAVTPDARLDPSPRWAARTWLRALATSRDQAVVSEAQALLCRVLAAEGDAAGLQAQIASGRCPR